MIYFNFTINNPFSERFETLFYRNGELTKNKAWEVQLMKDDCILILGLRYAIREDHAGLQLSLGLFGYFLELTIHDVRHWDYANGRWQTYTADDTNDY